MYVWIRCDGWDSRDSLISKLWVGDGGEEI